MKYTAITVLLLVAMAGYGQNKKTDTLRQLQHQVKVLTPRVNAWKMFDLVMKWYLEYATAIDSVAGLDSFRGVQMQNIDLLAPNSWDQTDFGFHDDGLFEYREHYDTVPVLRLVSNTLKRTWWRQIDNKPHPMQLFMVRDTYGESVQFLNRRKTPLAEYWKVWPNF